VFFVCRFFLLRVFFPPPVTRSRVNYEKRNSVSRIPSPPGRPWVRWDGPSLAHPCPNCPSYLRTFGPFPPHRFRNRAAGA